MVVVFEEAGGLAAGVSETCAGVDCGGGGGGEASRQGIIEGDRGGYLGCRLVVVAGCTGGRRTGAGAAERLT